MPTFEITTHSTFENKYLVTAPTYEEAVNYVLNEDNSIDFFQKHLVEVVVLQTEVSAELEYEAWVEHTRSNGYF